MYIYTYTYINTDMYVWVASPCPHTDLTSNDSPVSLVQRRGGRGDPH